MKIIKWPLLIIALLAGNTLLAQHHSGPVLEQVAALDVRPGDVAVSAEGRVFATIHPLGSSQLQLVEIKNGKAVPYPSLQLQKNGNKATEETLDAPLGIIFDKNNRLWVTDMGLQLGKTRLWSFDISKNEVTQKIALPDDIAPAGTFAQDVAIDEKNNRAYFADISHPGIIALNLETGRATRWSGHPSLLAEDKDLVIDHTTIYFGGKPARVAIDPITLSADRETIYFGAMVGTAWYQVPAKLFRDGSSADEISAAVKKAGNKPMSDGAITDAAGNHYFTDLQEHAITRLDTSGHQTVVIRDARLLWPDNVYIAPNGWMYISTNQLNTTPAFTGGADTGKPSYYIYRFKFNAR